MRRKSIKVGAVGKSVPGIIKEVGCYPCCCENVEPMLVYLMKETPFTPFLGFGYPFRLWIPRKCGPYEARVRNE